MVILEETISFRLFYAWIFFDIVNYLCAISAQSCEVTKFKEFLDLQFIHLKELDRI